MHERFWIHESSRFWTELDPGLIYKPINYSAIKDVDPVTLHSARFTQVTCLRFFFFFFYTLCVFEHPELSASSCLGARGPSLPSCHVGFAGDDECGVTLARQLLDPSFVFTHWGKTCVDLKREEGEKHHHYHDAVGYDMHVFKIKKKKKKRTPQSAADKK